MRRRETWIALAFLLLALPFRSEFACKRYDFAQERWIRLDTKAGDLEVQDVIFQFPSYVGPRKLNVKGRNMATINVKNYGTQRLRVHIAVALFDASGNLVGCGTTGSKLGSTKPSETESFFVAFDYVNSQLSTAQVFYLTVETEPDL
ncbi:MAG: hypothetical protein AB1347_05765 [Acidobacteriota bacterium]